MERAIALNETMLTDPSKGPAAARPRVLVVDDERGPRESLRMILSGNHEVVTADNGAVALEVLRTGDFDLVTVDLNMPGMKGDELIRTVRAEFPQVELIIITGCSSIETAVEGIRHGVFDYLTKPFDVVQVLASVERALARRNSRGRMVEFLEGISRVLGVDRETDAIVQELEDSPAAQQRLREALEEPILGPATRGKHAPTTESIEFLEVLGETIESRDLFMRGHARRVAFFADLVAERLLLARDERNAVRIAAFLHDIGKIGSPSDLVDGKSMPEAARLEAVRIHTSVGEKLLRPLGLTGPIATSVRHHHERFDGAGYPDGLCGEDIPLAARIISVVDAYDAMTCERPYRRARTQEDALAELRREAGGQFDPNLVAIFSHLVERGAAEALGEASALCAESPVHESTETPITDRLGAA